MLVPPYTILLKVPFDVENFGLKFELKFGKYELSFETSKFKFGSFSISYNEWNIGQVVGPFFREIGPTGILKT